MFLAEAIRLGRILTDKAIRHDGRCTWFGDDFIARNGFWQRTASALGPDFATGTAGVGWFLARLNSVAGDADMAAVAIEALRQSVRGAEDLMADRRLGFHAGAAGVAWAAVNAGRALGCPELVDNGIETGRKVAEAAGADANSAGAPGLWNGEAGTLAGLLGLWDLSEEHKFGAAADDAGGRLIQWVSQRSEADTSSDVGLANGASGAGLALTAWSLRRDDPSVREAANDAFRTERAWLVPGMHWYGASAHAWADDAMSARSLCSGVAGIGIARLAAYAVTRAPHLLAEAAAAIEVIRAGARPDSPDASLCHGVAGEIELLLSAWTALGEPSHLDAARRMGSRMVGAARARGAGYGSGLGEECSSPSLFLGLAGTGLVLLRLHDPALVPGAALPSVLS